jgi:hypothetical protein
LAGLDYDLGSGFALHPLFVRWVDEQIKASGRNSADIRRKRFQGQNRHSNPEISRFSLHQHSRFLHFRQKLRKGLYGA